MAANVLIIGEDPALVDFSAPSMPPGMSAAKVMDGLNGSASRLKAKGYGADILLTRDAATVEGQVTRALDGKHYDVIVIGAGLRTLPPMADQFERLMNVLREKTPQSSLAFNSNPGDTDASALRWL